MASEQKGKKKEAPIFKRLSLVMVMDFEESSLLLGLKKKGFGKGKWNGFGGKQEQNESIEECAARELKEESGLSLSPDDLSPRAILNFNMLSEGMVTSDGNLFSRLEVHVFSCSAKDTKGELVETEEMAGKWWPFDKIPYDSMWADDKEWLPHVLHQKGDVLGSIIFKDSSIIVDQNIKHLPPHYLKTSSNLLNHLRVDHLVFGVGSNSSLDQVCEWFYKKTGVVPVRGGVHEGLGTYNAIVGLGNGRYFEIIARDPGQKNPEKVWMGMDLIGEGNRMLCWAADRGRKGEKEEETELDACVRKAREQGYDAATPQEFSRMASSSLLKWRLSFNHYTSPLPGDGIVPFLIDWSPNSGEEGGNLPANTAPKGCELISFRAKCPQGKREEVEKILKALGVELELEETDEKEVKFCVEIMTPNGVVEIE
mmetsp:Transcript_29394/g.40603  ORF Transcript_29394/g.40603 Transcript_29394/m.40603 type:complete len:425 (+) Transcript_29394:89-1363(+)